MTDHADDPRQDHVLAIDIDAPIERVWEEITKTGRIQRALYNTVLETTLIPGARLRYYSPDKRRVFIVGEIVAVEAPHKFAHTFVFTQRPEPPTLVTWELAPTDTGTRVTLTHTGFTDAHAKPDQTVAGWREILGLLKHDLETGNVPLKTRILYRVMGALMWMLPATTKVEHADEQGW